MTTTGSIAARAAALMLALGLAACARQAPPAMTGMPGMTEDHLSGTPLPGMGGANAGDTEQILKNTQAR